MTLLPALLLLILIPLIMLLVARGGEKTVTETPVTAVYVADETGLPSDYGVLSEEGEEAFRGIAYHTAGTVDDALRQAEEDDHSLVLAVSLGEEGYSLQVIRPENTALSGSDARDFADHISEAFPALARQKSGLTEEQLRELSRPIPVSASTSAAYRDGSLRDGFEFVREVLEMALPYLCVMVLYFMVLIYGQGTAGNVLLEKSSKLMDTMLLSLRPEAMILGKTLAVWLAGILQMAAWVVGCVLGCVLGRTLVLTLVPGSTMGILTFFDLLGAASGLFTLGNVLLAAAIILAGFLMYCGIASIGGALASKPEDLGTTNSIFTLLLLASFFLSMFGGGGGASMSIVSSAAWMDYVPFTAVMCTPARALLGKVSPVTGLISLVLTLLLALGAMLLGGRLYRLMIFHRGNPPKPGDIPKLLHLAKE
jgi:ABC-type Na+ efflux pump permease subunit